MPVFPLVIMLIITLIGAAVIYAGARVWKTRDISLLHEYHRNNVQEKDIPDFSKKTGKAVMLIGTGIFATSVLYILTQRAFTWIIFALCLAAGVILLLNAEKRYNQKE